MLPEYNKVHGIHPGAILKRELTKRKLKSLELARSIGEHPQTLNAITKGKRGINAKLSIKLGTYFKIENEYFMLLQAAYEVSNTLKIQSAKNNHLKEKFRASIFWNTEIERIDLERNKRFIIQRVLERGSQKEIKELIKIYTATVIRAEIDKINDSFIPNFNRNVELNIKTNSILLQ